MRIIRLPFALALVVVAACGEVPAPTVIDAPDPIDAAVDAVDAVVIDTPTDAALTVSRSGTGAGSVTSSPAGITCGATCTARFALGSTVTLTAAPDLGSGFVTWGGACAGASPTCVVTITADTNVTATFGPSIQTVTVTTGGTGAGTVTSSPAGINCGNGNTQCSAPFAFGAVVTLTATPAGSSLFGGWSGGTCSGIGPCMFTVSGNATVNADFPLDNFTLIVTKAGIGTGTVTSSPAGISCGATCTAAYTAGAMVTLTATPAAGSVFVGWSGACTGAGTCTVAMTQSRMVTASFALQQFTLTVTRAGTGTGTVTSSPSGINCGTTCAATYDNGTSVVLTAVAAGGSTFAGWSGACTGTGTCTVVMTAARAVTATFNGGPVTITIAKTGPLAAGATVTSSPAGITCGATCSGSFAVGTVVTLTQTVGGSIFNGWSGAGCSGTGTCVFTVGAATTVTAAYRAIRVAINVNAMSCLRNPGEPGDRLRTLLLARGHAAVFATAAELDTAAEINLHDVIVLGGPGNSCGDSESVQYDGIIDAYIRTTGRGVVASGWFLFSDRMAPNLVADLPASQVNNFFTGAQTVTPVAGHPITAGLGSFPTLQWLPWGGGPRPGATSLLSVGTTSVGSAWSVGNGRTVYLGPMFMEAATSYDNEPLLDGTNATTIESFLRSIEWAAKGR